MLYDLVMAGLGVCDKNDIAISVLTSVIGHQKRKGWVITDAGWMALSRDKGTASQKIDQGSGLVCNVEGEPLNDLIVSSTNQEHGIISNRSKKKNPGSLLKLAVWSASYRIMHVQQVPCMIATILQMVLRI
jgi:D-serine deaminase-like pyridoxal phosphate-dependent protein